MLDLHVHTHHSCDSAVSMDAYCQQALATGVEYICFTEHVDFNQADEGYGYYDIDKFFKEFKKVKDKYADELNILSGIEFSEPHIYQEQFKKFSGYPYDFILGSIHFWVENMFASELVKKSYPVKDAFKLYWQEVYKAVSYGGFDALAHIDFPKRYYKESFWTKEQMEDIFRMMVKNNIALEINTSSLRKGLSNSMPDKELLDIYRNTGGTMITIGADSHRIEDLAADYEYAQSLISGNLRNTVFIKREANYISFN